MKSNLALTTKLALVVALLSAGAFAQTYTYVIEREGNSEVGRPISALTITDNKAYGSATAQYNQLYEGQPTAQSSLSRTCRTRKPLYGVPEIFRAAPLKDNKREEQMGLWTVLSSFC
jgi:hypothetical protein